MNEDQNERLIEAIEGVSSAIGSLGWVIVAVLSFIVMFGG